MKIMKKSLFTALAVVCMMIETGVSAQEATATKRQMPEGEKPSVEQVAKIRAERLGEKLSLSEQQVKEIYELNLEAVKQRRELAETRQENAAKMKQILTAEQYATWEKMKQSNEKSGHKFSQNGRLHKLAPDHAKCDSSACAGHTKGCRGHAEGKLHMKK